MRWLITGVRGNSAPICNGRLPGSGDEVRAVGHGELDILDLPSVTVLVNSFRRDIVVNAAAYTAIDAAESDENAAYRANLVFTGSGDTTWFGFARAIFEELGADPRRVRATTTAALLRPAPRPAYSVLSMRSWQTAGLSPMPH